MPRADTCHLDSEFDRMRHRLLDPAAWSASCPVPELQRDMLDMLLRSLRSETLGQPGKLLMRPVTWHEARAFIARHHSHHLPPQGWKFGCGIEDRLGLVGVVGTGSVPGILRRAARR